VRSPFNRHRLPQLAADLAIVVAAWFFAFRLRFDTDLPVYYERYVSWEILGLVAAIKLSIFALFGFYNRWWRYVSTRDMWGAARGVVAASLVIFLVFSFVEIHVAAVPVAFFILTFFHIVLGELAPKSIALTSPEKTARAVVRPLLLFSRFMSPLIWLFNGAANWLLKLLGVKLATGEEGHSPEEIRFLVMQAHARGTLDESDRAMLAGVLDFHEKKARDVMRPRTDVVALDVASTEEEVWEILRRERYSRYPVFRESLDDVIGVFLAKDLWLHAGDAPFNLADFVREPMYVPDSRPAERVLDDLRKTRAHMAVVLDEYGGTAGIVTMEDLVEEVVGDIADEYDFASRESVVTDGVLELAGSLSLIDVRSDYRVQIPEGDWTTLGGYAFAKLGRLPRMGDRIPIPGGEMEVVAMDGRRIAALRIHRAGARQPAVAASSA